MKGDTMENEIVPGNIEVEVLETDEEFNQFQKLAEGINNGLAQVAMESQMAQDNKEQPVFYGEYDGETIGEMMEEFYDATQFLPEDEHGFVDGTFVVNVTFIKN